MNRTRQIVILDGYTLTHGDLDWEALRKFGEVTVYERTPLDQIPDRAAGAEILITNKAPFTRSTLQQLPDLKYIGITATGTNIIDLEACRDRNILVTNVPDYGADSVAQLVFTHILNLAQRVSDLSQAVREGEWSRAEDFCFWKAPMVELRGLSLGIVGYGSIGQSVARLGHCFAMRVLVHTRSASQFPDYVKSVNRQELFQQADVVSLHCPLTPETDKMVDADTLAQMKPSAFLINTARGGLVDQDALARALHEGTIAGAGLDVLAEEPPSPDNPLFTAPNCYITPHIAWATLSARTRLMHSVVENVAAYLRGEPQNVVS